MAAIVVRVEHVDDAAVPCFVAADKTAAGEYVTAESHPKAGTPAEDCSQFAVRNEKHPCLQALAGDRTMRAL
jgi:hypothetical protein